MLEALGIDPTTERVYLAVLRHPELTTDRLAAHLRLTAPAVRGAVERLCRLALVRSASGSPVPVRPDVAVQALLTRRLAELAQRQREVARSKSVLSTLVAEYTAGRRDHTEQPTPCCTRADHDHGNGNGSPLGAPPVAPADGEAVSEEDRAILRCLSMGMKDEAVARQVGVSVRTLRRQIAALMDRLGAQSRFEAGVRASERNWL